jgi:cystathionine gamma-lyase/homocysteine desulfhydrase
MRYSAGDHLLIGDDLYGGTFRLQSKVFERFNISATLVDTSSSAAIRAAIRPETKAILIESPTNPLLKVTDLRAVASLAHAQEIQVIVDNTFMTPYWQQPLALGADIVWHSATKYLGGHSDVVGGLVVVRDARVGEELAFLQNAAGGVPGPQDCFLLIRGIKTLAVRMEAHETNARRLASWLQSHPKVQKVYYPGLAEHPGHAIQRTQAAGFGGMLSFDVGDPALAEQVLARVRLFTLAESLGAVESLIELPARMTHASIPRDHREAIGVTDSLIRLSVGIEDPEDLIEDLAAALA